MLFTIGFSNAQYLQWSGKGFVRNENGASLGAKSNLFLFEIPGIISTT